MNPQVNLFVLQKPLVDKGLYVTEDTLKVPVRADQANQLPAQFAGRAWNAKNAPQPLQRDIDWWTFFPDDSLAFGGYSGVNFLRRDTKVDFQQQ